MALDDFGEGNSNLEVLRNLMTDYVKISGIFCKGVVTHRDTREIVRAQVEMIRRLGLRSVMEFVENDAELQALRELGVDLVQGWHVARPAPFAELVASDRLDFT